MLSFLATLGRVTVLAAVALAAAAAYGVAWLGARRVAPGEPRRRHLSAAKGRLLARALTALGATYIKLGQVMSTRPDLFEPELIAELRRLQDRLPPFGAAAARRRIAEGLGRPVEEVFADLEAQPLAAASVAQVHRGRLHSGERVAVKVLRPDVRHKVRRDRAILRSAARALAFVSARARAADVRGHLAHFMDGVVEQTDLRREVAHYRRFRDNFADVDGVVFPRVFEELSAETVMTMEFIEGRKVDTLAPGEHPEIARILREAFLKMLFEDGFLHADLHPGNMLVVDDQHIAIFDVGLVKDLPEALLEQYIDFNKCLVMGTTEDFVNHLRTYHSYAEGTVDWARLEVDVEEFTAEFRGKPAHEIEFRKLIDHVFDVGRRHGIRPVPDMTLMMVGLVTAEGIGKQLDPESDSFGHVAQFLLPILARRGMLPQDGPLVAGP